MKPRRRCLQWLAAAPAAIVPALWAQPVQRVVRIGTLRPSARTTSTTDPQYAYLRNAMRELGYVEGPAFDAWDRRGADALFVQPSLPMKPAIDRAMRNGLPSCSFVRGFVEQGGFLAYAPSLGEVARQAAGYVDRMLRGALPADLPVQQIAVFDLLINQRSARALGITVPAPILLRASEVIE